MEARKKTLAVLNRHLRASHSEPQIRIAGFDPEDLKKPKPPVDNQAGSFLKRAIPKDHPYDPRAIKPLAKMLWAMSVALGHALTAHRQFARVKSSTVSPDGLLGGRGYVMSMKDIRKTLYNACEDLSAISDTIHDELNAPHWKPRLAQLERDDVESIERLVGEAEQILEHPEEEAEEGMEEAEEKGAQAELEEGEGEGSQVPGAGKADEYTDTYAEDTPGITQTIKQASTYTYHRANSSVPVETLSGPRVQHLDRADTDQTGPFGSHNTQEPMSTNDDWSRTEGIPQEYAYQSEWDNELLDKTSGSNLPGTLTDTTPTEARDFGLGYGAHGQGTEDYGLVDSDGKEVFGPYAQLPDPPGGKRTDEGDTTPMTEVEVGRSSLPRRASTLPNDVQRSVARSDYYDGDKGDNEVNANSDLPGVPEKDYEYQKDVQPGMGYRYEQGFQPYIKWDSDTHNMREDYVYQRDTDGLFEREG